MRANFLEYFLFMTKIGATFTIYSKNPADPWIKAGDTPGNGQPVLGSFVPGGTNCGQWGGEIRSDRIRYAEAPSRPIDAWTPGWRVEI